LLAGCKSAPPAVRTEFVNVPVPVVKKLADELTRDCVPVVNYKADRMTVGDVVERLAAVEDALAICRNEKALIRAAQAN